VPPPSAGVFVWPVRRRGFVPFVAGAGLVSRRLIPTTIADTTRTPA